MKNYTKSLLLFKIAALTAKELASLYQQVDLNRFHNTKVRDLWHLLDNVPKNIKDQIDPEMSIYDLWASVGPLNKNKKLKNFDKEREKAASLKARHIENCKKALTDPSIEHLLEMTLLTERELENLIIDIKLRDERKKPEESNYKEFDYKKNVIEDLKHFFSYGRTIRDFVLSLIEKHSWFDRATFDSFIKRLVRLYGEYKILEEEDAKPSRERKDPYEFKKQEAQFFEKYLDLLHRYTDEVITYGYFHVDLKEKRNKNNWKNKYIKDSYIFDSFLQESKPSNYKPQPQNPSYSKFEFKSGPNLIGFEDTIIDKHNPDVLSAIDIIDDNDADNAEFNPGDQYKDDYANYVSDFQLAKVHVERGVDPYGDTKHAQDLNYIYNNFFKVAQLLSDI